MACLLGTENPLHTALQVLSSALLTRSVSRACRLNARRAFMRLPFASQLSYACEVTGKRLRVKDTECSTALLREAEQYDEVGPVCSPTGPIDFSTHYGTHCAKYAVTETCLSECKALQRCEGRARACSWRVL